MCLYVYQMQYKYCHILVLFFLVLVHFSEQFWLFNGQVEDSAVGDSFFHPLNGTEHGSPPSLTTRDR